MAFSRYNRAPVLDFGAKYGTSRAIILIRRAVVSKLLPTQDILLTGTERLDVLAGKIYGDASYWWILAAASEIGWGLQVPAGTVISVPELDAVSKLVG